MIPIDITFETVNGAITAECADLTEAQVLQKLESAKHFQKDAKTVACKFSYMIGKEISAAQKDELAASYKLMMKKFPPEERVHIKYVWNEETKKADEVKTIRYVNPTPAGFCPTELDEFSPVETLDNFIELTDDDKVGLSALIEAMDAAETVEAYKTAQTAVLNEKKRMVRDYRIVDGMHILKANINEYRQTKALGQWENANAALNYAKFKVLAYQAELNRRATEMKKQKIINRAAKFMNKKGAAYIESLL